MSYSITYFNMNKDGDEAIVRILHSNTSTIERVNIHSHKMNDKRHTFKCLGSDTCPLCSIGDKPIERVFIHLWDYSDNSEKVWVRTDKILKQFDEIVQDWGSLNDAVVRIRRIGDQFPKYEVKVLNAKNYEGIIIDPALVDTKCAYRFYLTRNAEEIAQYLDTGVVPERQKDAGKNYNNNKYNESTKNSKESNVSQRSKSEAVSDKDTDLEDPFADKMIRPRKV